MFAVLDGTVDQALERERAACRSEVREITEQLARLSQRLTEIVRAADDRGDWKSAGCSSSAQWLAQISSSDHRTAARITRTSEALRELPALDHAMSTGALTLDQVAAAAEFATPETDAHLARVAIGKAPSAISLAARTIVPPAVSDDQELYERRSLSMTWTRGRRELAFSGRLPLEQGTAFEQAIWSIAKEQRAADKRDGTVLEWQQSAADALVTLARQLRHRRWRREAQPHHARSCTSATTHRRYSKAPARSAPRPPSDSPATPAASPSSRAAATSCTPASDAAPPTPSNAHCTNGHRIASTPAAPPPANSKRTT